MTTTTGTRDALFAEARRTPLTRGAVEKLAARVDPASVAEHALAAALEAGPHVATVLACVLACGGRPLPRAFVRALLPELDAISLFGPIVAATEGDRVELCLEFLDVGQGNWERETLATLLAAASLASEPRDGEAAPPSEKATRLLVHARRLARHDLATEAGTLLGAAAIRLGDKALLDLAAPFVTRAKKGRRGVEETLALARRPVLDALGDAAPRVVGGDYTVRKQGPDVGRNDPCPCGSGKKFKKCCAQDAATPSAAPLEVPRIDEATLHPEQARELRVSEIAGLDLRRVPTRSLPSVYRRALTFRRWALAEAVLEELTARKDRKGEIDQYRLELLDAALEARDGVVAEAELAKLGADRVPPALRLDVACIRGEADIRAIEENAVLAVRGENEGVDAIELAFVLLRNHPALGILVARGALHEGRVDDSKSLLQAMEDARDRLLLPPFEPWWELYDALVKDARDRKKSRVTEEEQAEMARELRRARAESRGAAAEVERMRKRLEELDASIAARETGAPEPKPKAKPDADEAPTSVPQVKVEVLEEERKRLRGKVEELQRIIGEGQDERRELRNRLTELAERPEPPVATAPARADVEPERDDEASLEDGVEERPRGMLVPVFSDRAAKSVGELVAPAAEAALALVAALAACRENAWGSVKRLTKARGVYSARAGIHHRILFGIDERALRVHDIIHRRDLEQAVNRLVR